MMPFFRILPAVLAFYSMASVGLSATPSLSLAGEWRLRLDRANEGITQQWFLLFEGETFLLPGSLPQQHKGDPITLNTPWMGSVFDPSFFTAERYAPYREAGKIKVPFWLQPETYYAGAAWYQREFELPAEWAKRRVVLTLERPHWQTHVWVDGRDLGSQDSLSTPHVYDLGTELAAGRHVLALRIDNGRVVEIGENSHSISDHTQGNWNGVVGEISLHATAASWIDDLQAYPEVASRSVRVTGRIASLNPLAADSTVLLTVEPLSGKAQPPGSPASSETKIAADGSFAGQLSLGKEAPLWDEFQPALHRLTARLPNGETRSVPFGLRQVGAEGSQLTINGRKLFIRATLECAIFPKTGHPPLDVGSWERILRIARAHGLNSLRFHSWCPPEAAFEAGDQLGFYFQVEAASWPNQSTSLGDGKPVDDWLERETLRILRQYGNHPSFLLLSSCNEPGGKEGIAPYLTAWLKRHKAADTRHLFTAGSGWPQLPENQFHVTSDPRIQHWEEGLKSRINAAAPETLTDYRSYIAERTVPVISHEIGQWCVFPDFSEMSQYTGYLKPKNFEIFQDTLAAHHLAHKAKAFLHASGKLQTLCYKEDIEAALRTPGMGGFQLLDLHDFPGQGTALVGVLNPFWEAKGYVTANEYRRFCDSTVPLARLSRRVFTTADVLEAECEVAHYGPQPLIQSKSYWKLLRDDGAAVAQGGFAERDLPVGGGNLFGKVSLPLKALPAPARYRLVVGLEGTAYQNDWDLWVYPEKVDTAVPAQVVMTSQLDAAQTALAAGRTVLLTLPPNRVANPPPDPVVLGFSSIFWNTSWTNRQPPTTLGILCDPRHEALADFPTQEHSNWQWWYVVSRATPLRLDGFPETLEPIVSVIDDWTTSRRLALIVEARVGRGRLIATSIDFSATENLVTRQLLASLLRYAGKAPPKNLVELNFDQVRGWVTAP